ncbi:MAG: hypothetical protein DRG78_22480 [Epsilonproteobacteria bacterium]|nr:MAG: hypothetical protein DRG78_22480 [Campylobacterota bacterium]
MQRLYILLGFLFLLSGCSTTKPPVTEYKIVLKALDLKSDSVGCRGKSLKISKAFSSSSLMSLQMKYVEDKHKIYEYSQAQWIDTPNQEISSQVVRSIRDSELFKSTQNVKSRSRSDLVLEISIEDFMQYYSKNLDSSYSSVAINFSLIDARTSEVVATKTIESNVDASSLDAAGGVRALDIALSGVLSQNIEFLNEVCK